MNCPNCQGKITELREIDNTKYIFCPNCEWFMVGNDGTFVPSDMPSSLSKAGEGEQGPPSPAAVKDSPEAIVVPHSEAGESDNAQLSPAEINKEPAQVPGEAGEDSANSSSPVESSEDEEKDDSINVSLTLED